MDEDTGLVQALSPEVSFFNELLGWRLLVRYSSHFLDGLGVGIC